MMSTNNAPVSDLDKVRFTPVSARPGMVYDREVVGTVSQVQDTSGGEWRVRIVLDGEPFPGGRAVHVYSQDGQFEILGRLELNEDSATPDLVPAAFDADPAVQLGNRIAKGFGYSAGLDSMGDGGTGRLAKMLHRALLDRDLQTALRLLHPRNTLSGARVAFESLFDGRLKLPTTVKGTEQVVSDFFNRLSAAVAAPALAITPQDLEAYAVEKIEAEISRLADNLTVREVESGDSAIQDILDAHPYADRDDQVGAAFKAARAQVDNGNIRLQIIGTREMVPVHLRESYAVPFRSPDTLNPLTNPVRQGDVIQLANGSKWEARSGYVGNGWSLVRNRKTHPRVTNVAGQVDFIYAIVQADAEAIPAQQADLDFRVRAVEVMEELLHRGTLNELLAAANVRSVDAFEGLPMDERAAAYVKLLQAGEPPVRFQESYDDKVQREEHEAVVRRLQNDRTILQANGKPFRTEAAARKFQAEFDLADTHELTPVDGGFELQQYPPARRPSELRRIADHQANDPEMQRQEAAFARAREIGAAADGVVAQYQEGGMEIEEFEAQLAGIEQSPANVPQGVAIQVKHALAELGDNLQALEGVRRARGEGYIFAMEGHDRKHRIAAALATIDEFRRRAPGNGVDAEAFIESAGGMPDMALFDLAMARYRVVQVEELQRFGENQPGFKGAFGPETLPADALANAQPLDWIIRTDGADGYQVSFVGIFNKETRITDGNIRTTPQEALDSAQRTGAWGSTVADMANEHSMYNIAQGTRTAGAHPYDPDDMDAAVQYTRETRRLFAAGQRDAAYRHYLADPNGGANPGAAGITFDAFVLAMQSMSGGPAASVHLSPAERQAWAEAGAADDQVERIAELGGHHVVSTANMLPATRAFVAPLIRRRAALIHDAFADMGYAVTGATGEPSITRRLGSTTVSVKFDYDADPDLDPTSFYVRGLILENGAEVDTIVLQDTMLSPAGALARELDNQVLAILPPELVAQAKEAEARAAEADTALTFVSGLNRPGDFTQAMLERKPFGVEVNELSAPSLNKIAQFLGSEGGTLFIDSGAFSIFTANLRGKERKGKHVDLFDLSEFGYEGVIASLDFDGILRRYEELVSKTQAAAEEAGDPDFQDSPKSRIYMVMPDIVGDQNQSIALVARYAQDIREWSGFQSIRAIVPIQRGEVSLTQAFDTIVKLIGDNHFVVGIPSSEEAVTNEELEQFIRDRGHLIRDIHILGAAAQSRLDPKIEIIRRATANRIRITADAFTLRSHMYGNTPRAEALRKALANAGERVIESESPVATKAGNLPNERGVYAITPDVEVVRSNSQGSRAAIRVVGLEDGTFISCFGYETAVGTVTTPLTALEKHASRDAAVAAAAQSIFDRMVGILNRKDGTVNNRAALQCRTLATWALGNGATAPEGFVLPGSREHAALKRKQAMESGPLSIEQEQERYDLITEAKRRRDLPPKAADDRRANDRRLEEIEEQLKAFGPSMVTRETIETKHLSSFDAFWKVMSGYRDGLDEDLQDFKGDVDGIQAFLEKTWPGGFSARYPFPLEYIHRRRHELVAEGKLDDSLQKRFEPIMKAYDDAGHKDFADVIRAAANARRHTEEGIAFWENQLKENLAKWNLIAGAEEGTNPPVEPELITAADLEYDNKYDARAVNTVPESVVQAVVDKSNEIRSEAARLGIQLNNIEAAFPPHIQALRHREHGLRGLFSRYAKKLMALEKGYKRADEEGFAEAERELSEELGIDVRALRLAAAAETPAGKPADEPSGSSPPSAEIIEHVTGRGKTIRGVVRTDLTQDQAKAIDEFTFKKDGGWFIREKHMDKLPQAGQVQAEGSKDKQTEGENMEAKEPWQMRSLSLVHKGAESIFPLDSKVEIEDGKPVYTYWTTVKHGGEDTRFEIKSKSSPAAATKIERLHKKIVQQALSEGRDVPAEVLADYPDLTPGLGLDARANLLLAQFPIGTRVRIKEFQTTSGRSPLSGRTGTVARGHFAGWYVTLDKTPREKSVKTELVLQETGLEHLPEATATIGDDTNTDWEIVPDPAGLGRGLTAVRYNEGAEEWIGVFGPREQIQAAIDKATMDAQRNPVLVHAQAVRHALMEEHGFTAAPNRTGLQKIHGDLTYNIRTEYENDANGDAVSASFYVVVLDKGAQVNDLQVANDQRKSPEEVARAVVALLSIEKDLRNEDPALIADAGAIALEAARIARREHPASADPRVDNILARELFLKDMARNQPEKATEIARLWRAQPGYFGDMAGVSPEKVGSYAAIIEEALGARQVAGALPEVWMLTRAQFLQAVRKGRDFEQLGTNPTPLSTLRGARDFASLDRQAGEHHAAVVTIAAAEGKDVPAAVMADYPRLAEDLAKGKAAAPAETHRFPDAIPMARDWTPAELAERLVPYFSSGEIGASLMAKFREAVATGIGYIVRRDRVRFTPMEDGLPPDGMEWGIRDDGQVVMYGDAFHNWGSVMSNGTVRKSLQHYIDIVARELEKTTSTTVAPSPVPHAETPVETDTVDAHQKDKALEQATLTALLSLGWQNQSPGARELFWVTKEIGGGYKSMVNPNGIRRVSARIQAGQLHAMHGDAPLVTVPFAVNWTAEQNAQALDNAVNAADPNYQGPRADTLPALPDSVRGIDGSGARDAWLAGVKEREGDSDAAKLLQGLWSMGRALYNGDLPGNVAGLLNGGASDTLRFGVPSDWSFDGALAHLQKVADTFAAGLESADLDQDAGFKDGQRYSTASDRDDAAKFEALLESTRRGSLAALIDLADRLFVNVDQSPLARFSAAYTAYTNAIQVKINELTAKASEKERQAAQALADAEIAAYQPFDPVQVQRPTPTDLGAKNTNADKAYLRVRASGMGDGFKGWTNGQMLDLGKMPANILRAAATTFTAAYQIVKDKNWDRVIAQSDRKSNVAMTPLARYNDQVVLDVLAAQKKPVGGRTGIDAVVLSDAGRNVAVFVDARYYAYFVKTYGPDVTFMGDRPDESIQVRQGQELIGVISPINMKEGPHLERAINAAAQPVAPAAVAPLSSDQVNDAVQGVFTEIGNAASESQHYNVSFQQTRLSGTNIVLQGRKGAAADICYKVSTSAVQSDGKSIYLNLTRHASKFDEVISGQVIKSSLLTFDGTAAGLTDAVASARETVLDWLGVQLAQPAPTPAPAAAETAMPTTKPSLPADEERVILEIMQNAGYGRDQSVLDALAEVGGYAALLDDESKWNDLEDMIEPLVTQRHVDIRNALRGLGWDDDGSRPMHHGPLKREGFTLKPEFKGTRCNVMNASFTVVGVPGFFMSDLFTRSASEMATLIDRSVTQQLELQQKRYTAPAAAPQASSATQVSPTLSEAEIAAWKEAGATDTDLQVLAAEGGYQAILGNPASQTRVADMVHRLLDGRIATVRGALQDLGWADVATLVTRETCFYAVSRQAAPGRQLDAKKSIAIEHVAKRQDGGMRLGAARNFASLPDRMDCPAADMAISLHQAVSVALDDTYGPQVLVRCDRDTGDFLRSLGVKTGAYDEARSGFKVRLDSQAAARVAEFGADFTVIPLSTTPQENDAGRREREPVRSSSTPAGITL